MDVFGVQSVDTVRRCTALLPTGRASAFGPVPVLYPDYVQKRRRRWRDYMQHEKPGNSHSKA